MDENIMNAGSEVTEEVIKKTIENEEHTMDENIMNAGSEVAEDIWTKDECEWIGTSIASDMLVFIRHEFLRSKLLSIHSFEPVQKYVKEHPNEAYKMLNDIAKYAELGKKSLKDFNLVGDSQNLHPL